MHWRKKRPACRFTEGNKQRLKKTQAGTESELEHRKQAEICTENENQIAQWTKLLQLSFVAQFISV